MFDITSLAGGALIGAGITWTIERWVALFLKQLAAEHSNEFAQTTSANNSNVFARLGIYAAMSIGTAVLCGWRQWSPELLNDLILVSALVGIAWIDRKTLLIEGRMVALALRAAFVVAFIFCTSPNAKLSDRLVGRSRDFIFDRFFV